MSFATPIKVETSMSSTARLYVVALLHFNVAGFLIEICASAFPIIDPAAVPIAVFFLPFQYFVQFLMHVLGAFFSI